MPLKIILFYILCFYLLSPSFSAAQAQVQTQTYNSHHSDPWTPFLTTLYEEQHSEFFFWRDLGQLQQQTVELHEKIQHCLVAQQTLTQWYLKKSSLCKSHQESLAELRERVRNLLLSFAHPIDPSATLWGQTKILQVPKLHPLLIQILFESMAPFYEPPQVMRIGQNIFGFGGDSHILYDSQYSIQQRMDLITVNALGTADEELWRSETLTNLRIFNNALYVLSEAVQAERFSTCIDWGPTADWNFSLVTALQNSSLSLMTYASDFEPIRSGIANACGFQELLRKTQTPSFLQPASQELIEALNQAKAYKKFVHF